MTSYLTLVKMTQYYWRILKMMKKYNFPYLTRPLIDIQEKRPERLCRVRAVEMEMLFSEN